jgi:hypothetical protein
VRAAGATYEVTFHVPPALARELGVVREVRLDGIVGVGQLLEHKEALAVWSASHYSTKVAEAKFVKMMEKHARFFEELRQGAPNCPWVGIVYSGGGTRKMQDALDTALNVVQHTSPVRGAEYLHSAGSPSLVH